MRHDNQFLKITQTLPYTNYTKLLFCQTIGSLSISIQKEKLTSKSLRKYFVINCVGDNRFFYLAPRKTRAI
jgi:aminopeptidase-like protein